MDSNGHQAIDPTTDNPLLGQPLVATARVQPNLEHRFNDDLLLSQADRELAQQLFPEIYHVLDHPELREQFLLYDAVANRAKLSVQRLGLVSVFLAMIALISSALTPLLTIVPNTPEWLKTLTFWAEIAGLLGAAIAVGGLLIAGEKKKWLRARMMAETLRLWHFQSLICRGNEIDASCRDRGPGGVQSYHEARSRNFNAFMHDWSGVLDSKLQMFVEDPEARYQLLHEEPTKYAPDSPAVEKVFVAYKQMRFKHQADYASHKLQTTTDKPWRPLAWPAAVLQIFIERVASFCLIGSLAISSFIVIGHIAGWEVAHHPGWAAGIIALVIINVASRAVQDGLAAPEELQRYNDYGGKICYLLARFEASHDVTEKLQLMGDGAGRARRTEGVPPSPS